MTRRRTPRPDWSAPGAGGLPLPGPLQPAILPGGALAAADYAARHGVPLAEAARLHDVSRQAVSDAARDPDRYSRTKPPGRKPRAGEATTAWIRFDVSPGEHDALRAAAARAGVSVAAWVRARLRETGPLAPDTPGPRSEQVSLRVTRAEREAIAAAAGDEPVRRWIRRRALADVDAGIHPVTPWQARREKQTRKR